MTAAQGILLAQVAPSATAMAEILAAAGNPRMEITCIVVANTTGTAATFNLCHDYDANGSPSFGKDNALWWDKSVPANDSFVWEANFGGGGIPVGKVGSLGLQIGTADALTVTIYGVQNRVQMQPGLQEGQ